MSRKKKPTKSTKVKFSAAWARAHAAAIGVARGVIVVWRAAGRGAARLKPVLERLRALGRSMQARLGAVERALDREQRRLVLEILAASLVLGVALGVALGFMLATPGTQEVQRAAAPSAKDPGAASGAKDKATRSGVRERLALDKPPPAASTPKAKKPPEQLASLPSKPSTPRPAPTWRRYAVLAPATRGRPVIALVIDDVGLDRRRAARVISLPAPLTIAFLPYAKGLGAQTRAARTAGHEIIAHVPMEPTRSTVDPGPKFLATYHGADEQRARLAWSLARLERYVGVSNHMGSRFTASPVHMRRLMLDLRDRGLLFLDSLTSGKSVGVQTAASLGVPHARRDVFLDNEATVGAVRRQLAELESVARHKGQAVGIGHPYDVTIAVLRKWIPEARRRGFVLVPISAIVRRNLARHHQAAGTR